jgi:hypothetical protein
MYRYWFFFFENGVSTDPYQSDTDTRVSVSMQHIPLQVREFQDGRILEHVHRWLLRYRLISFSWNLLFWEVRFSEKLLAGESAVWKIEVFVNFDYFECACFCVLGQKPDKNLIQTGPKPVPWEREIGWHPCKPIQRATGEDQAWLRLASGAVPSQPIVGSIYTPVHLVGWM